MSAVQYGSGWQGAAPLVCPLWAAGQHGEGGPSARPGSAGTAHTGEAGWAAAESVDGTPPALPLGVREGHRGVRIGKVGGPGAKRWGYTGQEWVQGGEVGIKEVRLRQSVSCKTKCVSVVLM